MRQVITRPHYPAPVKHEVLVIGDHLQTCASLVRAVESVARIKNVLIGGEGLMLSLQESPPDLILLNFFSIGGNSLEICRAIKADPALSSIPVIFITSQGKSGQNLQAFRAGAADYIASPFQVEELLARVTTHLNLTSINDLKREIAQRKRTEEALLSSQEQLTQVTAELNLAEKRQRRKIARSIQEEVIRRLTLGKQKLDRVLQAARAADSASLVELQLTLEKSIHNLCQLSNDLSSEILHRRGLSPALKDLTERFSKNYRLRIDYQGEGLPWLDEDLQLTLFQMVRELLINVIKHADASMVTVRTFAEKRTICLEVIDDGVGLCPEAQEGFGLSLIRQRSAFLGGTMRLISAGKQGVRVSLKIPVQEFGQRRSS